ncbi:MAG: DoxX family protein [Brevibacterium aurantiacum]
MTVALWIVNLILFLIFLVVGLIKIIRSKEPLMSSELSWTADVSPRGITAIGTVEVLGALGLVLPLVTGIAPALAPLAGAGLTLTMIGAVVVHRRRHESVTVPAVLLSVSIVSTVLGIMAL